MYLVQKTPEFDKWFRRLKDRKVRAKILFRIQRIEAGNLGDVESVGGGIHELRIHCGPGFRIYFKQLEGNIILLLIGGEKSTQKRDIERAKRIWNKYNQS